MASLLELVDQLIGKLLVDNVYTDVDPYRNNIIQSQVPANAYSHIPNTDPRLLNLKPPAGFQHPHDDIAKNPNARVIPPDPMHGTHGTFANGPLNFPDRNDHPHDQLKNVIPQSPPHGAPGTFTNGPLRFANRNDHPHADLDKVIPQSPPHGAPGTFPKGPLNLTNAPDHPHAGASNIILPHDTKVDYSTEQGLIQQAKRQGFYNQPPAPKSTSQQADALRSNAGDPPKTPLGLDFTDKDGRVLPQKSVAFYNNPQVSPQSSIQSLADFHQNKTKPPDASFVAEKLAADGKFPPKTPKDAPVDPHTGKNAFQGVDLRPLNFRGADDAPPRNDLVASFHSQKLGSNVKSVDLIATPQRHGNIKDNRYDDTDTPFEGNFQSVFRAVPPFLNYFNILATGHWLRNIADELFVPDLGNGFPQGQAPQSPPSTAQPNPEGIVKGITFVATQFLLTAMNPANPENNIGNALWNPLSIGAAIPLVSGAPIVGDLTNFTVASALGLSNYAENALALEKAGSSRLLLARDGLYSEALALHRLSKFRSPIAKPGFRGQIGGPFQKTLDAEEIDNLSGLPSVSNQVDGGVATELVRKIGDIHTNIYTDKEPYDPKTLDNAVLVQDKIVDALKRDSSTIPESLKLKNLFAQKGAAGLNVPGGPEVSTDFSQVYSWVAKTKFERETGPASRTLADAPGINAGVVEASLPVDNVEDKTLADQLADEDAIYMPFMFEDLRDPKDQKRYLYFRAFLKGDINETFTPEWQTDRYYGRVDQVPIYKGTVRNLNFTFDVAAFQYSDLRVIWAKLDKLQSMVYPTYDIRGFMEAGPMVRLKIGDLFAGESRRGLPGYITGMDWSFPDGIWNIEKGFRVPRLITIAITYTVIHQGNPGIYPKVSWQLNDDGTELNADNNDNKERIFGSLITKEGDGKSLSVSKSEIRQIFDSVRNLKNNHNK